MNVKWLHIPTLHMGERGTSTAKTRVTHFLMKKIKKNGTYFLPRTTLHTNPELKSQFRIEENPFNSTFGRFIRHRMRLNTICYGSISHPIFTLGIGIVIGLVWTRFYPCWWKEIRHSTSHVTTSESFGRRGAEFSSPRNNKGYHCHCTALRVYGFAIIQLLF